VKQSEGAIAVESAVGKGSIFKIYLPMAADAESDPARRPADAPVRSDAKGTLLLVEDEDSVRRFVRRVLEARGYRVLEARDGKEALELAEGGVEDIRLLITDLVMPRLGGKKLADRFRALRPEVRILIMSGYSNGDLDSRSDPASRMDFLQKPFRPDQLIELVDGILERDQEKAAARRP
jgi:DNA-binding NtrC family response regulator